MTAPIAAAPRDPAGPAAAVSPERQAARQLESFFLRQFLVEARPKGGLMDGGFAGDTFRDMLDSALADSMAASGGFGLTSTFETALGGEPAPPHGLAVAARYPESEPVPGEMIRPAAGRFSSRFGVRVDPLDHSHKAHNGLDIAAREGTPVVAALGGTVARAGAAGTYGNLVVLQHPDGSETRYAHLSAVSVKVGDHVAAGAPLGAVGTTGRSTGPHLHFEVRRDGRPVDPWPLLPAAEKTGPP